MAVTARFYVAEITRYANGTSRPGYADPAPFGQVVLRPALKSEANKAWASATPSGEIKKTVSGPALAWYEERLGKDLHITFDDVPQAVPAEG